MKTIILQKPSSFETRAVRTASMFLDDLVVLSASLEELDGYSNHLIKGAMPVGSVEFVRKAMSIAGITEPKNISYPRGAEPYFCRELRQTRAGAVIGRWFVKPVTTKAFTGFVFDTMDDPDTLSEHDQEQHAAFLAMNADEMVWISEPVQWVSEWRYYVFEGEIVGEARYDADGAEDAPQPDRCVVLACIKDLAIEHPYVVDFGVLSTGETALVEVNDAWAIGLYGDALSPKIYLAFLQARWSDIFKKV